MTQSSTLPDTTPEFPDFHPVLLCTASRRVRGAEASEAGYIQGAADDHEAWSHGLTPALFWSNKDDLLRTNEEDLPSKIAALVSDERGIDAVPTLIRPTSILYVSASEKLDLTPFDTVISCTPQPLPQPLLKNAGVTAYLHLPCQTGKLGSRDLRTQLGALRSLSSTTPGKTLVCCPTGRDLSVGAALAYLCLYAADDGTVDLSSSREARRVDKTLVKQRLSWITTSGPALNPSRATLQSVNSVLMSGETGKGAAALAEIRKPVDFDADWKPAAKPSSDLEALRVHGSSHQHDDVRPHGAGACTLPLPETPRMSAQQSLFATLTNSSWAFTRRLHSSLPTQPSGLVTGLATFTSTCLADTLLYSETGEFATDAGMKFAVRRRYVYALVQPSGSEGEGEGEGGGETDSSVWEKEGEGAPFIRVHFFDSDSRLDSIGSQGEGIGGLFVEMGGLSADQDGGDLHAQNRAQHLCGQDVYAARWTVAAGMLKGQGERWWEVRYDVKGPRKAYVSTTRYTLAGE